MYRLKQPPITDWDEMKMKLQEKYLPLDYEDSLFEELILLRQGNMTVDEYTNKFHDLSIRSQIEETGRQTLARFRAGLREDIRKELLTMRLMSVEEAYQFAFQLEQQFQQAMTRRSQLSWSNSAPVASNKPQARTVGSNHFEKPKPHSSSGWNLYDDRRSKDSMRARNDKTKDECYKCGEKGHYGSLCSGVPHEGSEVYSSL